MPVNLVKNPEEERLWERAKEQAAKAGHAKNWKYINSIFQTMKGSKKKLSKSAFLGMRQILKRHNA